MEKNDLRTLWTGMTNGKNKFFEEVYDRCNKVFDNLNTDEVQFDTMEVYLDFDGRRITTCYVERRDGQFILSDVFDDEEYYLNEIEPYDIVCFVEMLEKTAKIPETEED